MKHLSTLIVSFKLLVVVALSLVLPGAAAGAINSPTDLSFTFSLATEGSSLGTCVGLNCLAENGQIW